MVLTRRDALPAGFGAPAGARERLEPGGRHAGAARPARPAGLSMRRRFSVERACRQAGILPEDVDFFELCDAFSIYAALSLEAAGFARARRGLEAGPGRRLAPGRQAADQHHGRAEGARQPAGRHRRLPDGRSHPAAARAGRRQPAAQRAPRAGPIPGRPGLHRRHPRAGALAMTVNLSSTVIAIASDSY